MLSIEKSMRKSSVDTLPEPPPWPRITLATIKVLSVLVNCDQSTGAEIMSATSLSSGTIYPLLSNLERCLWIEVKAEKGNPKKLGRPLQNFIRLTPRGRKATADLWDELRLLTN